MARLSVKSLTSIISGCLLLLYFYHINFQGSNHEEIRDTKTSHDRDSSSLSDITCVLNREVAKNIGAKQAGVRKIPCKSDATEVWLPFSFIKNQYEARGERVNNKGSKTQEFELSHSYSKVYTPTEKYRPGGEFMHFRTFNVEARSRVLCVSARDGVPVSTQWDPRGYYYPTQIAQFALSHYSSHVSNKNTAPEKTVIEDGNKRVGIDDQAAKRILDEESDSMVIEFKEMLSLPVSSTHVVVNFDFKNINGATFKIFLQTDSSNEIILHYQPIDDFLVRRHGEVVFGYGSSEDGDWFRVTRDVANDLEKTLSFLKTPNVNTKKLRASVRVTRIEFSGRGRVANISLSSAEHRRMFLHGAEWFVENQDPVTGGWPTPVTFNRDQKKYPGAKEIQAGWYGAMCQGQAISVLVRAYLETKDDRFLTAAEAGVKVFNISSSEGGVRAVFLDKYEWYEEYPTNPPTFILNGFMYSLLGLYDLKSVSVKLKAEVRRLYQSGLRSLEAMLPLYDTGAGTFYDLRHFTMKTAPKGARWDYHSTHINQLLLFATIEKDYRIFRETAERWRGYMIGQGSSHN